jgi:hypothetical protein
MFEHPTMRGRNLARKYLRRWRQGVSQSGTRKTTLSLCGINTFEASTFRKIADEPSAIRNLEDPFAISLAIIAKGSSRLVIGWC